MTRVCLQMWRERETRGRHLGGGRLPETDWDHICHKGYSDQMQRQKGPEQRGSPETYEQVQKH
jgi:hypothetical protein